MFLNWQTSGWSAGLNGPRPAFVWARSWAAAASLGRVLGLVSTSAIRRLRG